MREQEEIKTKYSAPKTLSILFLELAKKRLVKSQLYSQNLTLKIKKKFKVYKSFEDGNLIKELEICGSYILLRLYLDEFSVNNPIGSSADKQKLLGIYYRFDSL